MSKEIAEKKASALAVAQVQEAMMAEAGGGFDEMDKDSFAIPFLTVLQKMSPQVDEAEPEHIPGAKPGMILNTVSNKLYDGQQGILVVPVAFQRRFVEFIPRNDGGGFVGEHDMEPEGAAWSDQYNARMLPNGHQIVDMRNHYVFCLGMQGEEAEPAVVAMKSTMVKESKRWNTAARNLKRADSKGNIFNPPLWSQMWRLTTVSMSNDKGTWYIYKVAHVNDVTDMNLYQAVKSFRTQIISNEVRVAYDTIQDREPGADDDLGDY